jgi:hypothetical protein
LAKKFRLPNSWFCDVGEFSSKTFIIDIYIFCYALQYYAASGSDNNFDFSGYGCFICLVTIPSSTKRNKYTGQNFYLFSHKVDNNLSHILFTFPAQHERAIKQTVGSLKNHGEAY